MLLLVGLLAVITVAGGVATFAAIDQRDKASRRLTRNLDPALINVNRLVTAFVDQETASRGFVITGDNSFLAPFDAGQTAERDAISRLHTLLPDDPQLLVSVDRLEDLAVAWRQQARNEIETTGQGGMQAGAAVVGTGESKRRFDSIRTASADLQNALITERRNETARADSASGRARSLAIAELILTPVLFGCVLLAMERWMSRPMRLLADRVEQVAKGDLDLQVPAPGPPELKRLGRGVERMRRRIRDESAEALRAREALSQSGVAVLAVAAELAATVGALPPGIDVEGRQRPMEGILAGDWFDVVDIGDGRVAITVVDVSGHGAVAGVYALRAKQLLLTGLRLGLEPGDIFGLVSSELGDTGDYFLTALLAIVDLSQGECHYANAGHPAGLIVADDRLDFLGTTGPLIGPFTGSWETRVTALDHGELLVAFTDGMVESRNPLGEQYGSERLAASLTRNLGRPAGEVAAAVLADAERFTLGLATDDMTLVVARRVEVTDAAAAEVA